MRGEVFAVLELELFLPTLFGRTRRRETVCRGITQNSGAKLFVNEDAGLVFWNSGVDRGLKAVVDDLLRGAIASVCSAVRGSCHPNIFSSNEPRWSNGRMYSGRS